MSEPTGPGTEQDQSSTPVKQAGKAARGVLGLIGSAVRIITGLFAAVLVIHIVLTLLGANPFNIFTRLFAGLANALTLGLGSLFLVLSPALQVILSYGIPAIAWLLIGSLIVAVLRAIARPRSGLRWGRPAVSRRQRRPAGAR